MVNHSLIKLVLFMAAGVVYYNLHKLDLNQIRGFGRNKTFLKICFAVGGLGIGGIPLFNGYVSKTLLHEGILESAEILGGPIATSVEWIFLISGGCTLAYMIKLFVAVFVDKNEDAAVQEKYDGMAKSYMKLPTRIALGLSTIVLPVLGIVPGLTMDKIADLGSSFLNAPEMEHAVHYFAWENIKGGLISIGIGLLIYFLIIRLLMMKDGRYVDRWPKKLDLEDSVYRPLILRLLPAIGIFFARICDSIIDGLIVLLRKTLYCEKAIDKEPQEGNVFTHAIGGLLDKIHYKLTGTDREARRSYEHRMSIKALQKSENSKIISRSLSWGLVLASVGLLVVVGYMLIVYLF